MSAQTLRMKGKLEKIKKGREVFEEKKRRLDTEMARSRLNMMNISRGIQKKDVSELSVKLTTEHIDSKSLQTPRTNGATSRSCVTPSSSRSRSIVALNSADSKFGSSTFRGSIVPTGPRVSDWCFVGSLDSDPPVVKFNSVYETVRMLGRGSFGDVNLVKSAEDNKLFALKTIFTERDVDMDETLREVRYLRMNRHPCIIEVHDGFITLMPRMLHIVMPYCESGDLDTVIKTAKKNKTNIGEDKILRWIVQIGLAIHFLHENGVIHRDLKPNNVMLTEGGEVVKLVDFGLAISAVMDISDPPVEAGTPLYTAPEIINNDKFSYPVDCWSFGVLLFELLNLSTPFKGNSTAELVASILNDTPPPITPFYSAGLTAITCQLLEKDKCLRMGMAGMLLHPFLLSRTTSFPSHYKPRNIEERIKRGQCKQLQAQIDSLCTSRNSNLGGPLTSSRGTTDIIDSPTPRCIDDFELAQAVLPLPLREDKQKIKITIPGVLSAITSADASLCNTLAASNNKILFSPVTGDVRSEGGSMTDTLNSTGGEEDADDNKFEEKEEGYDGDIGYGEMEMEEEKERNRDRDSAVGFLLDDVRRSLEFECKEEIDVHHPYVRNFTDTAPKVPATCQIGAASSFSSGDISMTDTLDTSESEEEEKGNEEEGKESVNGEKENEDEKDNYKKEKEEGAGSAKERDKSVIENQADRSGHELDGTSGIFAAKQDNLGRAGEYEYKESDVTAIKERESKSNQTADVFSFVGRMVRARSVDQVSRIPSNLYTKDQVEVGEERSINVRASYDDFESQSRKRCSIEEARRCDMTFSTVLDAEATDDI